MPVPLGEPVREPTATQGPATAAGVAGLAVVGALTVLVLVMAVGSGEPAGTPEPGALTAWGLPIARVLADLSGALVVGVLLAVSVLLPSDDGQLRGPAVRLARTAAVASAVLAVAAAATLVFSLAGEFGLPAGAVLDGAQLTSYVTDTALGRGLLVQVLLALAVATVAPLTLTSRGAAVLLVTALVAVGAPAFGGHTESAGDHTLALWSLVVHVVAVSLWVGGLAALGLVAARDAAALPPTLPRFSALALWCVVAVGTSGVVNAAVRLDALSELVSTTYGRLVAAKVVAFAVLAALGYVHRRSVVGRMGGPPTRQLFARLVAVEVFVMAGTIGLAVGLSGTHAPDETGQGVRGPAAGILGYPLPDAPTAARLLFDVRPDGFWLVVVVLGAALYVAAVRALRRRGDRWPVGRTTAWLAGLVVLALVTSGGVGRYAPVLFSVHMVQHMALNMVVPLLLVLGAPLTLALRALPSGSGTRQTLLRVLHSAPVRVVANPLVASAVFVGSLYGLYFSTVFEALMRSHWGHLAMQAHFLAAGLLFFWVLVGVDPGPRRLPYLFRLPLLFVVMALHAFFSVALLSMTSVLAADYYAALNRPWGGSLLDDQHLGGGIGWAFGEVPIVVVLVAVFVQWMRADEREARAADRAADRAARRSGGADSDDALAAYNAWLASLPGREVGDQDRPPGG